MPLHFIQVTRGFSYPIGLGKYRRLTAKHFDWHCGFLSPLPYRTVTTLATDRDLRRAEQVRRWLNDDLFNEIFDYLETEQLAAIVNSEPEELQFRESAYQMLKTIARFRGRLHEIASETAHARHDEQSRTLMQ